MTIGIHIICRDVHLTICHQINIYHFIFIFQGNEIYSVTTVHINSSSLKLTLKKTLIRHNEKDLSNSDNSKSDNSSDNSPQQNDYSIVRCGACGDSFSDYVDLIEHVQVIISPISWFVFCR
jgi:hypothetical protein